MVRVVQLLKPASFGAALPDAAGLRGHGVEQEQGAVAHLHELPEALLAGTLRLHLLDDDAAEFGAQLVLQEPLRGPAASQDDPEGP